MTFKQFLVAFKAKREKTGTTWMLRGDAKAIRVRHGGHCPLSFTAPDAGVCTVDTPASQLGLSPVIAERIADAADCGTNISLMQQRYRKALLRAAGL
jgi:hypothetical protein